MKKVQRKLAPIIALCVVGMTLGMTASLSFASGSVVVGGAQTGDGAAYQRGKRLYNLKLACDGCVMDGKKLNKDSAMMLLENGVDRSLSSDEKHDVEVYLKRRFTR